MRKIILTGITIVALIFASCTNENDNFNNDLNNKLTDLHKKIDNINSTTNRKNNTYSLGQVQSSINKFDHFGIELLQSLKKINIYIKNIKQTEPNASYNDVIIPFIQNEINENNYNNNLSMNNTEKVLLDDFLQNLKFENTIEIVKEYEIFVNNNFENQDDVRNFLIAITEIKFSAYYTSKTDGGRTFTQFENCVVDCMDNTYSNYNPVDWFVFIAGNPGRAVLQTFASCGWDCW